MIEILAEDKRLVISPSHYVVTNKGEMLAKEIGHDLPNLIDQDGNQLKINQVTRLPCAESVYYFVIKGRPIVNNLVCSWETSGSKAWNVAAYLDWPKTLRFVSMMQGY